MITLYYSRFKWLKILAFVTMLIGVVTMFVYSSYVGMCVQLVGFTMSDTWNSMAIRHYKKALTYTVSGQIREAMLQANPDLLRLPSKELQDAVDDVSSQA